MSKLAFTLIELIVVVILIGLVSFLIVRQPFITKNSKINLENLRDILYPNGIFYLFNDGTTLVVKDRNFSINLSFSMPRVYVFNGNFFERKEFGYLGNRKIIFRYRVKKGVGDSFILENGDKYYVFKPFEIKMFNSFTDAKDYFLLLSYQPKIGEFY